MVSFTILNVFDMILDVQMTKPFWLFLHLLYDSVYWNLAFLPTHKRMLVVGYIKIVKGVVRRDHAFIFNKHCSPPQSPATPIPTLTRIPLISTYWSCLDTLTRDQTVEIRGDVVSVGMAAVGIGRLVLFFHAVCSFKKKKKIPPDSPYRYTIAGAIS